MKRCMDLSCLCLYIFFKFVSPHTVDFKPLKTTEDLGVSLELMFCIKPFISAC